MPTPELTTDDYLQATASGYSQRRAGQGNSPVMLRLTSNTGQVNHMFVLLDDCRRRIV